MPLNDEKPLVVQPGRITCLTLNRPEVLNALNRELLFALRAELDRIREDDAVQGVLLTGAGDKAFSAGADIGFLHTASPLEVREFAELAISVNNRFENLGKVSIAMVNGFALGGGLELAESCMLRLAVPSARMGHPEVRIGAVAGWGGTTRLPRLIGKGRAAELLLTGRMIDAGLACDWGLVNRVVEADLLVKESEELLREIFNNGPVAVDFTWQALHRGLNLSIEESARLGADFFGLVAATDDFRTGTAAFLKRTPPEFHGK